MVRTPEEQLAYEAQQHELGQYFSFLLTLSFYRGTVHADPAP